MDNFLALKDRIIQLISAHPYTIYFSNELMEILKVPYLPLQQTLLKLADEKLVDYKDTSTKEGDDFMVKFVS